ncbi:MAG: hypothetical protein IAB19_07915 [Proteobacteria bacterium]|uniref:Uncharacterized protein n=1 Tax=Candidatus Avisuccinivibrio stercorigallinarum TaxID=2840704 RepID=A0A9D9GQU9_9GAMM|nr:hypothetical protein [Candidatus Avisuccinivibrio stercorigallinarum]
MSENMDEVLGELVGSIFCTAAMAGLGAAVQAALSSRAKAACVVKQNISGVKVKAPTIDETALDERTSTAASTESSLAHDEMAAQQGTVDAANTNAQASELNSKAAVASTNAVETAAGASEISTKALKMN